MANRVGTKVFGGLMADVIAELKSYTKKDVTDILWKNLCNEKVQEIHELMADKDKAIYKDKVVLTSSTLPKGILAVSTDNCTYTDATRTIAVVGATYAPHGQTLNSDFVGAKIQLFVYTGTTGYYQSFFSEIESVDTGVIVLKDSYGENVIAGRLSFIVTTNTSDDDINVSTETWYKGIDQILSVHDSGLGDECYMCKDINEFWGIIKRNLIYNYSDTIIFVRDGETFMFRKGGNVTSYGTRTLHYTRKPYAVVNDSDIVDIPDSQISLLKSLMKLIALQTIKVQIPEDLKSAETRIDKMRLAKEKEIASAIAGAKDN